MKTKTLLLTALLLGAGCFGDLSTNGGNIDDNGGGGGGSEGGGGGGGSGGGPNCGADTFPIAVSNSMPPNVKLVVDDSGSMSCRADQADCGKGVPVAQMKWTQLKSTMSSMMSQFANKARWGLSIFPKPAAWTYLDPPQYDIYGNRYDGYNCTPGTNDVSIGSGTESAVMAKINAVNIVPPDHFVVGTPTGRTMKALVNSPELRATDRPNYVILLTDGIPTCEWCKVNQNGECLTDNQGNIVYDEDYKVKERITDLYNMSPSVRTFVIGFGAAISDDGIDGPALLSSWAEAGHTARSGATKYYKAEDAAQLSSSLQDIISGVVSCDYRLSSVPANPENMIPYIDNVAVPRSATSGFTYETGTNSVVFHGAACDKLRSGSKQVKVIYGCPSEVIM